MGADKEVPTLQPLHDNKTETGITEMKETSANYFKWPLS